MPQVINVPVTLYEYDELPTERAKENARTAYGEYMTADPDWCEFDLEWFRDILQILGFINATEIEFEYTLHCGQGSGLSFTGDLEYNPKAVQVLKDYANLPMCIEAAQCLEDLQNASDDDMSISVSIRKKTWGFIGVHEKSVEVIAYDSDGHESEDMSKILTGYMRRVMQEFHTILEDEYSRYFSEEGIRVWIDDEQPLFTADGSHNPYV